MDDFSFDDIVDRKCDMANQRVYLSSSITMTATGTEAYNIIKEKENKLREKLISYGLEEVNMLPTPEESFMKRKRGRPKKGEENKRPERKVIDKHKNVTTELLLDTEQYRIGEIFKLLKSDNKDTTRQQAVRYLLSYSDLLDKDIAREVIAIANSMLQDETVRSTVKVKIASDLKAFLGTAGKKKFVRSTFEELRKEDGILEVEVPD